MNFYTILQFGVQLPNGQTRVTINRDSAIKLRNRLIRRYAQCGAIGDYNPIIVERVLSGRADWTPTINDDETHG